MKLHIYDNREILADKLAAWICDLIAETLKEQEFFSLVLSGGETPRLLYEKLASKEFKEKINWGRIRIFWGDERAVPFTDKRNNAKMAFDTLLKHVDIPQEQIYIINTDVEPNFAADKYRGVLHKLFSSTSKSFDLVLLGLGDDGHTLSLFPGSPALEIHTQWVSSTFNESQNMYRITMMPQIVNRAQHIVFLVEGTQKSTALKEVLEGKYDPHTYPAQLIKPSLGGELHWFIDKAASKKLSNA